MEGLTGEHWCALGSFSAWGDNFRLVASKERSGIHPLGTMSIQREVQGKQVLSSRDTFSWIKLLVGIIWAESDITVCQGVTRITTNHLHVRLVQSVLAPQNRVTRGSGWNLPLWNGTTLQDPHSPSGILQPDISNMASLAKVISLALLWQSWSYHNAICHLSGRHRIAWRLVIHSQLHIIFLAMK